MPEAINTQLAQSSRWRLFIDPGIPWTAPTATLAICQLLPDTPSHTDKTAAASNRRKPPANENQFQSRPLAHATDPRHPLRVRGCRLPQLSGCGHGNDRPWRSTSQRIEAGHGPIASAAFHPAAPAVTPPAVRYTTDRRPRAPSECPGVLRPLARTVQGPAPPGCLSIPNAAPCCSAGRFKRPAAPSGSATHGTHPLFRPETRRWNVAGRGG